jgi:hypothetical protein
MRRDYITGYLHNATHFSRPNALLYIPTSFTASRLPLTHASQWTSDRRKKKAKNKKVDQSFLDSFYKQHKKVFFYSS